MLQITTSTAMPPRPESRPAGPGELPGRTAPVAALDALDRELWRYAGQYALGDRWYVPGRFDLRECRWNRLEQPCSSVRGLALAVAGGEGEPVVRFVELRENGVDRLLQDEPRLRDELRQELRDGFQEGAQALAWRTGRPGRIGSMELGGAVCRGFMVPPSHKKGDCEFRVWIDEQRARVRRLEWRRGGSAGRGAAFFHVERELVRDYAPDAIGRWLSVEQRERTTYRQRSRGNALVGRVDRALQHADHWEYRGLVRQSRGVESGGSAEGIRFRSGGVGGHPVDPRGGRRHWFGLIG